MFCCLILYDFFDTGSMRTAKNEDGKTYYVPADMTYREWEKKFVVQKPKPLTEEEQKKVDEEFEEFIAKCERLSKKDR